MKSVVIGHINHAFFTPYSTRKCKLLGNLFRIFLSRTMNFPALCVSYTYINSCSHFSNSTSFSICCSPSSAFFFSSNDWIPKMNILTQALNYFLMYHNYAVYCTSQAMIKNASLLRLIKPSTIYR